MAKVSSVVFQLPLMSKIRITIFDICKIFSTLKKIKTKTCLLKRCKLKFSVAQQQLLNIVYAIQVLKAIEKQQLSFFKFLSFKFTYKLVVHFHFSYLIFCPLLQKHCSDIFRLYTFEVNANKPC